MFNWVKEFFNGKRKAESKTTSREAEKQVYLRQKEHHKRRMEASPSNYQFHQGMVEHCDDVLASKATTRSKNRDSSVDSVYMGQHIETNVRSSSSGYSSSSSSSDSGSSSYSCSSSSDSGSSCSGGGGCD
ncbi:MAG: hypothetical protein ACRC6V_05780 [Bacteroidales bacterium]